MIFLANMASNGLLSTFLGALQASLAVLLTISYGVIAAQFKLLDGHSATSISKVCVRMFLPALLITRVGAELHLDTAARYVPVLSKYQVYPASQMVGIALLICFFFKVWAISYTLISMGIGLIAVKILKLPQWVTPAVAFNNTTSLPLLLIQSLDATGILSSLVKSDESTSDAIQRATSYFLVCAIVGNSMTFALGPRLMDAENTPNDYNSGRKEENEDTDDHNDAREHNEEGGEEADASNEQTSLLPRTVMDAHEQAFTKSYDQGKKQWDRLHPNAQWGLGFLADFFNAPLIGALVGALIGLVPPLHSLFFNDQENGGVFNAWLTTSVSNIGDLFASLQVVVVGVTLSSSLRKLKRGEHSGHVSVLATMFIIFVRFIFWPIVSISFIWLLATKTNVLSDDPMLWFIMMLMPTGPPAMKLVAMAEVNGADDEEKMATSKILAISYAVTPLICFAVVGALKASQAAI
jgi:auxin efflux carrier family protein